MTSRSAVAVVEALERLAEAEKAAYLEARQRAAPIVLESEANPALFLREEKGDVAKAAKRMAFYFHNRKVVFGDERAFLPMNLTGRGALDPKDILTLQSGAIVPLPCDRAGRQVFLLDDSRLNETRSSRRTEPLSLMRSLFYLATTLAVERKRMLECTVLYLMGNNPQGSPKTQMQLIKLMDDALPMHLVHVQVLFRPIQGGGGGAEGNEGRNINMANGVINLLSSSFGHKTSAAAPVARLEDVANQLMAFGFSKRGLPVAFGGKWEYDSFYEWLEHQRNGRNLKNMGAAREESESEDEAPLPETEASRQKALKQVQKAVSLLPDKDKADFQEAVRRVPDLVMRESSPLRYLRFCKFDARAAAQRIASYWRRRVHLFGPERAFKPFDMTSNGALWPEDLQLLNTEFLVVLPPDDMGRPVMFFQKANTGSFLINNEESKLRVFFFVHNLASVMGKSQEEGISSHAIMTGAYGSMTFKRETVPVMEAIIQDDFPADLKVLHLLTAAKKSMVRTFAGAFIPAIMGRIGSVFTRRVVFHMVESEADLSDKLEACGLSKEHLPVSVGGSISNCVECMKTMLRNVGFSASKSASSLDTKKLRAAELVVETVPSNRTPENTAATTTFESNLVSAQAAMDEEVCEEEEEDSKPRARETSRVNDGVSDGPLVHGENENHLSRIAVEGQETLRTDAEPGTVNQLLAELLPNASYIPFLSAHLGEARAQPLVHEARHYIPHPLLSQLQQASAVDALRNQLGVQRVLLEAQRAASAPQQEPRNLMQLAQSLFQTTNDPFASLQVGNPRPAASSATPIDLLNPAVLASLRAARARTAGLVASQIDTLAPETLTTLQAARALAAASSATPLDSANGGAGDSANPERSGGPSSSSAMGRRLAQLETELVRQAGHSAVKDALDRMPGSDKTGYTEAIKRVPHLVELESNPLQFLRCEDFDAVAAATRLASYWNFRVELFGERAFLAMTQTGEGALSRDDVVVLSSASFAVLPNDAENQSVLCADRSRIIEQTDAAALSRLRCLFYLLSVLSEDENNQKDGIVLLIVLIQPRVVAFDKEFAKKAICIAEKVAPVRLKSLHLLVCPPKTGKRCGVETVLASGLQIAQQYCDKKTYVHVGYSPVALMAKLAKHGLREDGLPASVGGSWKYNDFATWQRHRNRVETGIETSFEGRQVACRDVPDVVHRQPARKLSETERRERKRKLNVIHSRQKRERRRAEMTELQEECNELADKNFRLKRENKTLEGLLDRANACVEAIGPGTLQAAEETNGASAPSTTEQPSVPLTGATHHTYEASASTSMAQRRDPPTSVGEISDARTLNQLLAREFMLARNPAQPEAGLQSNGLSAADWAALLQGANPSVLASLVGLSQMYSSDP